MKIAGWILTGVAGLFLFMDAAMKIVKADAAVKGTLELGYPEGLLAGLGAILLLCTIVYLIPRTAIVGAVLLTGYLGGAIATQVRVGNPLFTHALFPIYLAIMIWGALYLRDQRVRALYS